MEFRVNENRVNRGDSVRLIHFPGPFKAALVEKKNNNLVISAFVQIIV